MTLFTVIAATLLGFLTGAGVVLVVYRFFFGSSEIDDSAGGHTDEQIEEVKERTQNIRADAEAIDEQIDYIADRLGVYEGSYGNGNTNGNTNGDDERQPQG